VHAKELHPGKRNSLDALCDRYGISNAHRKLHGALLDSELLADVYLAMTRGQNTLSMDVESKRRRRRAAGSRSAGRDHRTAGRSRRACRARRMLAALDKGVKGECVWRKYSPQG
jgi:DNA polymerase-3 subunit epsilon